MDNYQNYHSYDDYQEDDDLEPTAFLCPYCKITMYEGTKADSPDDFIHFMICKNCDYLIEG